ncbi:MAG: CBS domain-containing protein [Alphaproteobacteria bacterium]|nr:CBS domain-containing protein [Alphaproteobacteria bacterium]
MTTDVAYVSPDDTLRRAAEKMDDLNVGVLPVCDANELIGVVTDRDITIRSTAAGHAPDETAVSEAMTTDLKWCLEDDPVADVVAEMTDLQVRRMPVLDGNRRLVGMISLGDLATRCEDESISIEHALARISQPSRPDR